MAHIVRPDADYSAHQADLAAYIAYIYIAYIMTLRDLG
jgi:hypothetical protein